MSQHRDFQPDVDAAAAAPKRRGRPSKLTAELIEQIAGYISQGRTKRMAASLAGTYEQQLATWLKRGRELLEAGKASHLQAQLVLAVDAAEASFLGPHIDNVSASATDRSRDYRPSKWLLSVRAPKDFATQFPTAGTAQADEEGAAPTVSPEAALQSLTEKMARFLADYDRDQAAKAPVCAAPEAGDGG